MLRTKYLYAIGALIFSSSALFAQPGLSNEDGEKVTLLGNGDGERVITTAVPFLGINTESRGGGMGDVGAATSPDANSMYWNPAKLAFIDKNMGFSVSYAPWLRKLVNDMWLANLSGYKKISRQETFGVSLVYFNLGSITFTDASANVIQEFNPKEFAISGAYSRMLSERLSVAIALKFIHSNLTGNFSNSTENNSKPGNTAAADVGFYYKLPLYVSGKTSELTFGSNISNLGAKMSYTQTNQQDFIPTNLRLGTAFKTEIDPYNTITFAVDANKLMVPTPPVRTTEGTIVDGKDPNRSLMSGVFGSFSDAPGGFNEEMKEISISAGMEYWYNELFAVRGGYFHEHEDKGGRKYLTAGMGIRYQLFGLDFSYLAAIGKNNPLSETLRFTLLFNFDDPNNKPIEDITE